jgi:hypothetical protein
VLINLLGKFLAATYINTAKTKKPKKLVKNIEKSATKSYNFNKANKENGSRV